MKRLEVAPLTRVEGHGRVELGVIDNRLAAARVLINESPRLFEGMVLGREAIEIPSLVCRICAICSTVHRLAACQALEQALGVTIPPRAALIRELALLGGHIESHALHLYCLIYPDLVGADSVLQPLQQGDGLAREGIALKALGNKLQTLAGGRRIHPINLEIGGVLHAPSDEDLATMQAELSGWIKKIEPITEPFFKEDIWPEAAPACGLRIAVDGDGQLALTGEKLICSDGSTTSASRYRELLQESALADTNAKQSRKEGASLLTGALARCELARPKINSTTSTTGIHANNAAQGTELVWSLERAHAICQQLRSANGDLRANFRPGAGSGTCVIEAPRGILIHHYELDDMGRVGAADIITPTAINSAAMEEQLLADLSEETDELTMRRIAERIIRAYDPCISCSVHLLRLD